MQTCRNVCRVAYRLIEITAEWHTDLLKCLQSTCRLTEMSAAYMQTYRKHKIKFWVQNYFKIKSHVSVISFVYLDMKQTMIMLSLMFYQLGHSQETKFGIGVIAKAGMNQYRTTNGSENTFATYRSDYIQTGLGFHSYYHLYKNWMVDGSLLFSRAKYQPDLIQGIATFRSADIRFTEFNVNLNYFLNSDDKKTRWFVYTGAQLLFRRWGIERYVNKVIPQSYWPDFRWQYQTGFGCKIHLNNHKYLMPFMGIRLSDTKTLIYDTRMNQIFIGAALGLNFKGGNKDRYKKCPSEF